ncbi:MAG TPA: radical SAM family heme chaperone HemW [Ignavibacteria bacterium]|nr:radical SAM family heme chaperone HemW [Ignavibacteria bacterium]
MSGLYLHIPFCSKRCNYCNFYFSVNKKLIPDYISALKKEINLTSEKYHSIEFDSVYFGGGTPSLLSESELSSILDTLYSNFKISPYSEISIESNPEDLDESKIKSYINKGINRLSLGIQSLNDNELIFLSRKHNRIQSLEVINLVKKYFNNYSLDIIYSLPGQTFENIKDTLDIFIQTEVPHISAYTLTFEENTLLHKNLKDKLISKNSTDIEADLFLKLSSYLNKTGYSHYEVSSFSKSGFESKHNSKYWTYTDYIGFGPSAHSFYKNKRWNNYSSLGKYIRLINENKSPIEKSISLNQEESKFEFLTLSLRHKGINFDVYEKLFNEDFKIIYDDVIKILKSNELAEVKSGFIKLTDKGYLLADEICSRYF